MSAKSVLAPARRGASFHSFAIFAVVAAGGGLPRAAWAQADVSPEPAALPTGTVTLEAVLKVALAQNPEVLASGTRPATEANSVCIGIAHTCHEYEASSAKAKDCHEKGHSKETTEAQCEAMRRECLDECTQAAEAARGQGATGESAHGASSRSSSRHRFEARALTASMGFTRGMS
jgi:hypothetical protein